MFMDLKILSEKLDEVSLLYTKNYKIKRDADWYILKLQEELGELIQSYLMLVGQARKKGKTKAEIRSVFEAEIADVFSHVVILAKYFDVDLEKAVEKKWLKWTK